MLELKTPAEIDAMREAGRLVARVLAAIERHAAVGVSLRELDELASDMIADAGAKSSFLHYQPDFASSPYPAVICASVNDAIVHGIPDDYLLADGDLLSVDFGAYADGWCGDAAISLVVGNGTRADTDLIDTTRRGLEAGIAAAAPGNTIGDVAHAVGAIGRAAGYGILADHGGHGVGRAMHEAPHVPNDGPAGRGLRLRPGMAVAIEPMFIAGGRDDYRKDADGWTVRSADGTRAAHIEHTIAITEDGPRILTAP